MITPLRLHARGYNYNVRGGDTMKYANLHLHSIYSDAWFTPYQLVVIGKALG